MEFSWTYLIRNRFRAYRLVRRTDLLIFFITAIIFFRSSILWADDREPHRYLDFLIDQAIKGNLAQKRYWQLLLHYKKSPIGGYESEEDGPAFFNSSKGKTDPQAELIATLKSFFQTVDNLKPGEEHPQCNFPARYKWLKSQLSFDSEKLPEQHCERLEGWLKGLNPEKITLIFASYYMNNPASMFGHTLLRIDKKREGPEQNLLDYGVNYAATVDTRNALVYTVKGLLGMFKGTFSLFPYYEKVQEYSNWESRDLWEYELNLTEDQMNTLLLHLWELGGNYFDYLYFQENCSYHILSLLEVANSELHLTDQFFFAVIPADTVKVLTQQKHLIIRRVYRPSLLSQMYHKQLQMSKYQQTTLQRLEKDPSWIHHDGFQSLDVAEKALVLDAYLDYAQYKNMQSGKEATAFSQEARDTLLERSRLGYQRKDPEEMAPFSTPPELGHDSSWITIGAGIYEKEPFTEVSYRPAYHDLLAKDTGYSKDSQILFFDLRVRYYHDTEKFRIDSFKLLDIISLTPYDSLLKKKSWKLSIGVDTIKDEECNLCNAFKVNYGIGLTYKPSYFSPILLYSLIDFDGELSSHLDEYYRAGGGVTMAVLLDISDHWRLQILGDYLNFPLGHESDYYKISIDQRYSISRNLDLRANLSRLNKKEELMFAANYYF